MMKIYLAGFIQGTKIKECSEWRKRIREHFDHNPKWHGEITFLDPLNGKELDSITDDGLKSSCTPHSIVHRDYKCVDEADLIVANMDTFGEDRPLTGTICELAWAWDKHVPIVMITDEAKYKDHPFLSYFSSWIVKNVDELLEKKVIQYFYKGVVTALY